jgi:HEAT repeat protein
MSTGDPQVKIAAIQAWIVIRNQTGAAPVAALVQDADAGVRAEAAGAVGRLREASARTALEAVLGSDTDAVVRRNAAWALGRIGDPASRTALTAAASDPSPLVGATAKAALAALR